jgi:hypothetical protein
VGRGQQEQRDGGRFVNQLVMPPSYDTRPEITTEKHSHVGRKGDLTIELHYGDFGDGRGRQPALFIYHLAPRKGGFMPLSDMWQCLEKNAFVQIVKPIAECCYGFVTRDDMFRVMDAILDYLDDLREAPPAPKFRYKNLDDFLESCERVGLSMFVDINGDRLIG